MADIKYEVVNRFGVIGESSRGWRKELSLVKWNDRDAKFDIREWSPEGDRMGKGITLSKEEAVRLKEILNSIDL